MRLRKRLTLLEERVAALEEGETTHPVSYEMPREPYLELTSTGSILPYVTQPEAPTLPMWDEEEGWGRYL